MKIQKRERPIIFSGEMVRAILDGKKTQTRRVIKLEPRNVLSPASRKIGFRYSVAHARVGDLSWLAALGGDRGGVEALRKDQHLLVPIRHPEDKDKWEDCGAQRIHCPFGSVGDRLWVRETWRVRETKLEDLIEYRADGDLRDLWDPARLELRNTLPNGFYERLSQHGVEWRPSIHVPRAFSRITLEITKVRVERLQEISEEDALAEGCKQLCSGGSLERNVVFSAKERYRDLWDSLHGKGAWELNPWVWVLEFKRIRV